MCFTSICVLLLFHQRDRGNLIHVLLLKASDATEKLEIPSKRPTGCREAGNIQKTMTVHVFWRLERKITCLQFWFNVCVCVCVHLFFQFHAISSYDNERTDKHCDRQRLKLSRQRSGMRSDSFKFTARPPFKLHRRCGRAPFTGAGAGLKFGEVIKAAAEEQVALRAFGWWESAVH